MYSAIDAYFENNKTKLICNINITGDKSYLNNLFDPNFHVLVTFGPDERQYIGDIYHVIPERMSCRWVHLKEMPKVENFSHIVNMCYIDYVNLDPKKTRVTFSLFTTCYNSFEKILRAHKSILAQKFIDWEWVILDDSTDVTHFDYLKRIMKDDKRIRLYKRSENSGNIGNVKNEVVSLCRGQYVLEMDHDDEILPDTLGDAVKVFEKDPEVGFVYADFINLYEDGTNFDYGDFFGLGHEGYYLQKYNNQWVYVCSTANINNITLSHIVAVPNHPRIWKKDVLVEIGNYSEFLPICDDYHILVRTAMKTKMAKLHKFCYVQYMNKNNNNFSLIRNEEINRLTPQYLRPLLFNQYKINEKMKELGKYDDEKFAFECKQIWKRENFDFKYCNSVVNLDYEKQYCIVGRETLLANLDKIVWLYHNVKNDFLLLDNNCSHEDLCKVLDTYNFDKMKCYAMKDATRENLVQYFHLIYRSVDDYEIIDDQQKNEEDRLETKIKVLEEQYNVEEQKQEQEQEQEQSISL